MRFFIIPSFIFLSFYFYKEKLYILEGETMGTSYRLQYFNKKESFKKKDIENFLEIINHQMSTYRSDSEITQINQSSLNTPIKISQEFEEVLKKAFFVMKEFPSYDVTLGHQINSYGFGPEKTEKKKYLQIHPLQKITLKNSYVKKLHPNLYLDLSSIAKGYALDFIGKKLDQLALKNYLLEIGGEVKAKGKNQKRFWKIAIENPLGKMKFIYLKNESIATSGIYRNFFQEDSYIYTHIFSPKTGQPIQNEIYSLSILHQETALADAYATALMPLKKNELLKKLEEKNLKAYVIFKDGSIIERL